MIKAMAAATPQRSEQKNKKNKQWVVSCPQCRRYIFFSPEKEGQPVRCPQCGQRWQLERPFLF